MNTNMAEGASERLDAQIADALFGQPGMSRVEVANQLRQLRGTGAPLLVARHQGEARRFDSSAEDRFEQFVQAEIARSPNALRELGEYLGNVLDEDKFPTANRLLLQLATEHAAPHAPRTAHEPNSSPNRLASTEQSLELEALMGVAAEYQSWIEFHAAGNGDYDDFLRKQVLSQSEVAGDE